MIEEAAAPLVVSAMYGVLLLPVCMLITAGIVWLLDKAKGK